MDNFFQIIFILFLIISFLAPLFKKKQEGQKKPPQSPNDPLDRRASEASKIDQEEYDILGEIQDLFKNPVEKNKQEYENSYPDSYEDESYETPEWKQALKTEHSINDEWHRPTTEADFEKESALIDEEAKRIQKFIDDKNKPVNVRLGEIRKSIKNPETLKQYYLISEILGKPRAYNRRVR